MSALNWSAITDGGAFESLMHALLYAEAPGTMLFGRRGPDSGQDARSADGKIVYQAKYRTNHTMDEAIRIAKEELVTIKKNLDPNNKNYHHWQKAERWILVANISLNPNDVKWSNEVVPLFQTEGLIADYWSIETLEGKLVQHPEIREVFFSGENRVLIGLKEARDLLVNLSPWPDTQHLEYVGHEKDLKQVEHFSSLPDKRILPVMGKGGVGKTRFLFESLLTLSLNGWRVFWGLPASMSQSTKWFQWLNGLQDTCVAIDDLEEPQFLQTIIEQLASVERRRWKVLVSIRQEHIYKFQRFFNSPIFADKIILEQLDEDASKKLLISAFPSNLRLDNTWLRAVYNLTQGMPGWLMLVAKYAKEKAIENVPLKADVIAKTYIEACLLPFESLEDKKAARTLLHWIALWEKLSIDTNNVHYQSAIAFLAGKNINLASPHAILSKLVEVGLLRNWGYNKRIYSIEPVILQQHILSDWLLEKADSGYRINSEGDKLITEIVEKGIPFVDSALASLTNFAHSRLEDATATHLFNPLFDSLTKIAKEGSLLNQYRIVELLGKVGQIDPERALDVLQTIWCNKKADEEIKDDFWGITVKSHAGLLHREVGLLTDLSRYVASHPIARRYILFFDNIEESVIDDNTVLSSTNKPLDALQKIIEYPQTAQYFRPQAYDILKETINDPSKLNFTTTLAKALLEPMQESTEWSSRMVVTFSRYALPPESKSMQLLLSVRELLFDVLKQNKNPLIRIHLWPILASTVQSFHMALSHGFAKGAIEKAYRLIIVEFMQQAFNVLSSPPHPLSIEEATHARAVWAWFLKYGDEKVDPVGLAMKCEDIFRCLSVYKVQDFFKYHEHEQDDPEVNRIYELFNKAISVKEITLFFDEAIQYLNSSGNRDEWRILDLAQACKGLFLPELGNPNPVTAFVLKTLKESSTKEAFSFAVHICKCYLGRTKAEKMGNDKQVAKNLKALLSIVPDKTSFLVSLFDNPHPKVIGPLTLEEKKMVFSFEKHFTSRSWAYLLGVFYFSDTEDVKYRLTQLLSTLNAEPDQQTNCITYFLHSFYRCLQRYHEEFADHTLFTRYIFDLLIEFKLDASLLKEFEVQAIAEECAFKMTLAEMVRFIESRIEIGSRPVGFNLIPHDFEIAKWCTFEKTHKSEVDAFKRLCSFVSTGTFVGLHWIPIFVAQLDPEGKFVSQFVREQLSSINQLPDICRLAYLASSFDFASVGFEDIAIPFCEKMANSQRDDRYHVYFSLSKKSKEAMWVPQGDAPPYYYEQVDRTKTILQNTPVDSPLYEFRKWSLKCAEADLKREKGLREEDEI